MARTENLQSVVPTGLILSKQWSRPTTYSIKNTYWQFNGNHAGHIESTDKSQGQGTELFTKMGGKHTGLDSGILMEAYGDNPPVK